MSIFDLHTTVLGDYRGFVRSFFSIADQRAREFVDRSLVEETRMWPDFLLQVSPSYARADTVDDLATTARADLAAASAPHRSCTGGGRVWQLPRAPTQVTTVGRV